MKARAGCADSRTVYWYWWLFLFGLTWVPCRLSHKNAIWLWLRQAHGQGPVVAIVGASLSVVHQRAHCWLYKTIVVLIVVLVHFVSFGDGFLCPPVFRLFLFSSLNDSASASSVILYSNEDHHDDNHAAYRVFTAAFTRSVHYQRHTLDLVFFCFCFFIVVVIVIVQSYSPHTYLVQCHYGHWSWQTPTSLSVISCLCRQLPLHHLHHILLLQSLVLPLRPLAQRSCRSRLPPPLPAIQQFIGSTSQPQTLAQATSSTSTSFFCFLVSLSLEL